MIVCDFAPLSASCVPTVCLKRCAVTVGLPSSSMSPAFRHASLRGVWKR